MEDWLVDACNLLFRQGRGAAEEDRERLRTAAEGFAAGKKIRVTLVYDSRDAFGPGGRRGRGNVVEIFVRDADDYIVSLAQRSRRPRSLQIVSDDRADIISRVRRLGCRCVDTADFWRRLHPKKNAGDRREPPKPESEDADGIARYLRLFGGD